MSMKEYVEQRDDNYYIVRTISLASIVYAFHRGVLALAAGRPLRAGFPRRRNNAISFPIVQERGKIEFGILLIPRSLHIGVAIEELVLIWLGTGGGRPGEPDILATALRIVNLQASTASNPRALQELSRAGVLVKSPSMSTFA